jgi:hypothetical protein
MLSVADINLLRQKFDNDNFAQTLPRSESLNYNEHFFVKVTALGPNFNHYNGEDEPIEWGGQRA